MKKISRGSRRIGMAGLLVCASSACQGSIGERQTGGSSLGTSGNAGGPQGAPNPGSANGTALPPRGAGGTCESLRPRSYRLTPTQLQSSFVALLGTGALDARATSALAQFLPRPDVFSNIEGMLTVTSGFYEQLFDSAASAAKAATQKPTLLAPCFAQGISASCVSTFIGTFAERVYRRPLSSEEKADLESFYTVTQSKYDATTALTQLIRRLLLGPDSLFRSEWGAIGDAGRRELTPYETASALSYWIADGPPDESLWSAAREGRLSTPAQIGAQAERLLSAVDTSAGIFAFFSDLLRTHVPAHPDQPEATRRLVEEVLYRDDGRLETLLTARYSFTTGALRKLYWGTDDGDPGWRKSTPVDGRVGALSQGATLSAAANPSARGNYLRHFFLCEPPVAPPANVPTLADETAQAAKDGLPQTEDEIRAAHMSRPACSGCHRQIDPLGIPFSVFDKTGAWQTTRNGKDILTASTIAGTDFDGPVADAPELLHRLASSASGQRCFTQRMYEYAYGISAGAADRCSIDELSDQFAKSGGDIRRLVVAIASSDSFRLRSSAQP